MLQLVNVKQVQYFPLTQYKCKVVEKEMLLKYLKSYCSTVME